jgi:Archaeal IMP cyclohydrolase
MKNLIELLKNNAYPGRGLFLGKTKDGNTRIIYFIMGRSENSRNRIFSYTHDGIRTQAFDPDKLKDPSLVIYHPVRFFKGKTIVTNGDQTDTIRQYLENGRTFREALMTREYEPDAPSYTPRISGIVTEDGSFELSILKSAEGCPECSCRYFYNYDRPLPGMGYFISTYKGDGNPLPSFEGEPVAVSVPEEYEVWDALDCENKVSLYSCELDSSGSRIHQTIINKLTENHA